MRTFVVSPGHAKPLWAGHPWVHADGAREIEGDAPGETHDDVAWVRDREGRTLGRGLVSDASAIRIRMLDRGGEDGTVEDLLRERIRAAAGLRARLFPTRRTTAYRLVHAEGDGLPGLVVDRYGPLLVAQFATRPMFDRRRALADALLETRGATGLLARPGGYEAEEGIPVDDVPLRRGDVPDDTVPVLEEGMSLRVEARHGQKTGHYVDQRENRLRVAEVARGREVLDLFAGTAGFSIQALRHGALSSLAVDASRRQLELAEQNAVLSGVSEPLELRCADARSVLRDLKEARRTFDVVVLDPPNMFPKRGAEGAALKAYRDLNVQALTRLRPGGMLATFSCSARLVGGDFLAVVTSAARDCRRRLRVLRALDAGPDHPVLAAAPQGRYLSGFLLIGDV